jgi:hypothetical protein
VSSKENRRSGSGAACSAMLGCNICPAPSSVLNRNPKPPIAREQRCLVVESHSHLCAGTLPTKRVNFGQSLPLHDQEVAAAQLLAELTTWPHAAPNSSHATRVAPLGRSHRSRDSHIMLFARPGPRQPIFLTRTVGPT